MTTHLPIGSNSFAARGRVRIEAIVEGTAIGLREMQVKQDRMQQLDQRFNELGDFIAAVSNDVAQLAENQQQGSAWLD